MMMRKTHGFNFIEMLITLIIIAILSAIAVPSYSSHITHANRIAAEVSLSKLATRLEQYNTKNNTYQNATLANLNIISPKNYQLEIVSATDTNFMIAAHPLNAQQKNDSQCATLTLDSQNEKGSTGSGTIEDCW